MNVSSSDNTIEISIPSILTSLYDFMIYVLSLLFLLCYRYPKASFIVGMVLSYTAISTIFDAIIRAFFITPIHRLPLAIVLILVAIASYIHHLIKVKDKFVLRDALQAAELATAAQSRFLDVEERIGFRSNSSGSEEEGDGNIGLTRERTRFGGIDMDVWQGGKRMKRKSWTTKKSLDGQVAQ